jgi:glycosyltransferase involved in cell wall biosynthesis
VRVMYDISVLGAGFYDNKSKTGIARVVQNLAQELVSSTLAKVTFCAAQNPRAVLQTLKYFQVDDWAQGKTLEQTQKAFARNIIHHLCRFYPLPDCPNNSKPILDAISNSLSLFNLDMSPRRMDEVEIFHSTYHPVTLNKNIQNNVAKVLTIYDLIPVLLPQFFNTIHRIRMQRLLSSVEKQDRILVISESTKSDLCEYTGMDPDRVDVTHLAASKDFFPCLDAAKTSEVRLKYGLGENPYVLSLCTFEPRKNIDQTIRSFIALVKQQGIQDLNLVLVGTKGWDFDKIFAELEGARELSSRIITTGFVPDCDLAPLYSAAMMFAYPSLYEGFGLPPLEAMQCGVPVITSNNSSLPEVVGDAGIMVSPKDGEAISHAMLGLYRDSKKRATLSTQGLLRSKLFSWKKCADQTTEAYRRAMQQQS